MSSEHIEQVRLSYKLMKEVQSKHVHFGACDTEPDSMLQGAIAKALKGQKSIPRGIDEWELYDQIGANQAAIEMTEVCEKLVDLILATTIGDAKLVEEIFDLWRVNRW